MRNFILLVSLFCVNISFSQEIKHVIVIGVDGMSSEGLKQAVTPTIDSLIKTGSVSWKMRVVLPTVSSPNWASMIHGAGPEQHSITSNDWKLGNSFAPIVEGENGRFPSVFDVVRFNKPSANIGAVYHWEGFGELYDHNACDFNKAYSTPDSTAHAFSKYIVAAKPAFAFMQLDHVDGAGHKYGHMTEGYLQSISKTDALISFIIDDLKDAKMLAETLIIITADHGGIGYGHGGETIEELTVPVVLNGPNIKSGYEIKQQVYIYDIAATVTHGLQIIAPYAWIGRPILPAFKAYAEPSNLWMGKEFLAKPVILPERKLYDQSGGLYVNEDPIVAIAKSENPIFYTLDGTEPNQTSFRYERPFTLSKSAVVKAKAIQNGKESRTDIAYFRIVKGEKSGLNVSYFDVSNDILMLPNFSQLSKQNQWQAYEFRIDNEKINEIVPKGKTSFALVFEGDLFIEKDGNYTFYTQSDDGSKLYINNQLIVNNDGDHGVVERLGEIELKKGYHHIRVEYFNAGGGYWLETFYSGPDVVKQIIPADKLLKK